MDIYAHNFFYEKKKMMLCSIVHSILVLNETAIRNGEVLSGPLSLQLETIGRQVYDFDNEDDKPARGASCVITPLGWHAEIHTSTYTKSLPTPVAFLCASIARGAGNGKEKMSMHHL